MRTTPHRATGSRDGRDWTNDRGSILIPTAVALLALLAFSAFTIDNGVMLSSRRAAQNAADAGALAAALYLSYDDIQNQAGAQAAGVAAAQLHQVWDAPPDITLADVTFPTCPPGAPGPADVCVRVDVFRNQRAGGNPLPAFFAGLAGVSDQGVRATATAQVLFGTAAADCLLPFAVPDRYIEMRDDPGTAPPPGGDAVDDLALTYPLDSREDLGGITAQWFEDWDPDDTFDAYDSGGDPLGGVVDIYQEGPWDPAVGDTGYNTAVDHGMQVMLKAGTGNQIAPSFYYPILLPDGLGSGANPYRTRIRECTGATVAEHTNFTVEPGNMVGPTRQGIDDLVGSDLAASWDETAPIGDACVGSGCAGGGGPALTISGRTGKVVGGCQTVPGSCPAPHVNRSSRMRTIAIFDIDNYMSGNRTGRGEIYVTGFIGMFVKGMNGNDVEGYLTEIDMAPSASNLTANTSSSLRSVILVR